MVSQVERRESVPEGNTQRKSSTCLKVMNCFRVHDHPLHVISRQLIAAPGLCGRNRHRAVTIRVIVHHECLQQGVGCGLTGILNVTI
jgi:hypothetical protein